MLLIRRLMGKKYPLKRIIGAPKRYKSLGLPVVNLSPPEASEVKLMNPSKVDEQPAPTARRHKNDRDRN